MRENRLIQLKPIIAKNHEKMTCIIAGNCTDAVTIVADRKVRYGNGNVSSREKIFKDYHPYVVASSGDASIFDDFRNKVRELAQRSLGRYDETREFKRIPFDPSNVSGISQRSENSTSYPIIQHIEYLDGVRKIAAKKREEIRLNKDRYPFDILIASQTDDKAYLTYIDDNGSTNEITEPFKIIGSDSALFYGSVFVKALQKESTKISEFAELAYFTIKYIDRFGIDDTVGLMGEKPLVYFIPDRGTVERASDEFIRLCEDNTDHMLDNFESSGIRKLL